MKSHPTDDLVRTMSRVRDESLRGYADRPAARNLLDEVTAIAPPDDLHQGTAPSARAADRTVSQRRFRPSRTGVRLIAVGALAAVMAIGTTLVQTSGGPGDDGRSPSVLPDIQLGSVAEASEVLDRAAAAAKTRPFAAPKPQQWIYIKLRHTTPVEPGGIAFGGPYRTDDWESWRRADGKQWASYRNGKLVIDREQVGNHPRWVRFNPLPTDPDALLRKLRKAEPGGGDGLVFETLVTILSENVHPPKTEAAIFQAMKRIRGVTLVKGRVDAAGRPAIALGWTEDWAHEEILLDPKTYTYLGARGIAIKDHRSGPGLVRKGTLQGLSVRLAAAIVDEPGQRS
ncbi:CU044_5270 family protein [Actinomadura sp. 6N118]|uniref:CU044_5270 family protein n=1 Tax=Actinomadura sp. 6N118 TaxID=3375151 RepID=UPI0037B73A87